MGTVISTVPLAFAMRGAVLYRVMCFQISETRTGTGVVVQPVDPSVS